ncbi:MAG: hypothetical protein NTW67_06005 [Candidatus Woesearchaeota archaeon]|nr:hypothetical protein [Candidatus Woesearchaeota archaeon]
MRRKSVSYEKLAMPAFIIAVIVAIVFFYLIYTGKIGMSIGGTRSYACIQQGLSAEECASLQVVQAKLQYCCCKKETQQRGDRVTSTPVSFVMKGSRIGNTEMIEEVQEYCQLSDNECMCKYFCENVQPQSDITTTIYLGVGQNHYEACQGEGYERDINE